MRGVRAALAAACLALFATSSPLSAQDADPNITSAARQVGFEGVQAYEAGRYDEALEKLQRAYELVKVPTFGLWSARALVKLGRLVAASERYLEVTRIQLAPDARDIQKNAQNDARTEREALLPRIPNLTIVIGGAPAGSAKVTLDGKPVAAALLGLKVPVDPGKHAVEARVGDKAEKREVTLAESANETVRIDFPATPTTGPVPTATATSTASEAPPSQPTPVLPIVAFCVGGAGLALGAITGILAIGKHSDLESSDNCQNEKCLPAAHDDVDTLNVLRLVSTIGFIAGGAGVATGITLLVVGDSGGKTAPSGRLMVTPGGATMRGSF